MGAGARGLLRGPVGPEVSDGALVPRPRRGPAARRRDLDAVREGRIHLYSVRVVPAVARGRSGSVPDVRKSAECKVGMPGLPPGGAQRRHLPAGTFRRTSSNQFAITTICPVLAASSLLTITKRWPSA